MGATKRLQIMLGAGELRHASAGAKPGPSPAAALEKVGDGRGQRARVGVVPRHGPAEPQQAPLPHCRTVLGCSVQDVGRPMATARGAAPGGPESGRGREALVAQEVEAPEHRGYGPLCSPRYRRSALAGRRS